MSRELSPAAGSRLPEHVVTTGGNARPAGAVIGAYALVAFLEATRFVAELVPGMSPIQAASLREIIVALGLIVILSLRPDGLLPERSQKAPAR
jgi:branched-chain amino acid transport system permease protein